MKEVLLLIGNNAHKLYWMSLLFLSVSCLDLIGIGLIAPFVTLIVDPIKLADSKIFHIFEILGITTSFERAVTFLGCTLIIIFFAKSVTAILINRTIIRFCFKQSTELRLRLLDAYQSMPYERYLLRNSSEYIRNFELAHKFSMSTLASILRLVSDGLVAIVIASFLAFTSIQAMSVLLAILVSAMAVYVKYYRPKVAKYGEEENFYARKIFQNTNEGIAGLKEIRILGKESYFLKKMRRLVTDYSSVAGKALVIKGAPRYLLELIVVSFVVIMIFSVNLTGDRLNEVLPVLSMFGIASMRLVPAANNIITSITILQFGRNSVGLLYKDLYGMPKEKLTNTVTSEECFDVFETLDLKHITFYYPNTKKPALKDISLKIKKGDIVGIIGKSGSGKSTLADVVLGLLKPRGGSICVNSQELKPEHLKQWRSRVAYLPQQYFFIDSSIKNNVALGQEDHEIDVIKLKAVLKSVGLSSFIDELPQGVETIIGEKGLLISGGQRQRIAIARALYYDREIIVLDEPTSALDGDTEAAIIQDIIDIVEKKTLIIIAHSLVTLKFCNRIVRLENGLLVEEGEYQDFGLSPDFLNE